MSTLFSDRNFNSNRVWANPQSLAPQIQQQAIQTHPMIVQGVEDITRKKYKSFWLSTPVLAIGITLLIVIVVVVIVAIVRSKMKNARREALRKVASRGTGKKTPKNRTKETVDMLDEFPNALETARGLGLTPDSTPENSPHREYTPTYTPEDDDMAQIIHEYTPPSPEQDTADDLRHRSTDSEANYEVLYDDEDQQSEDDYDDDEQEDV